MNKDYIDDLFEGLKGEFDIHDTPEGHQSRFLEKLRSEAAVKPDQRSQWWKPLSIAASFLVLITAGMLFQNDSPTQVDLASVSPEMEKAESFFVNVINNEIATLQSFESAESEALVTDALTRLQVLEDEYDQLKFDLEESGNDKRVINAMINNFQSRIDLLQQVIQTIEDIETLKANQNETLI